MKTVISGTSCPVTSTTKLLRSFSRQLLSVKTEAEQKFKKKTKKTSKQVSRNVGKISKPPSTVAKLTTDISSFKH